MRGRVLLLLPHPDDEFACSMRVRDMVSRGMQVHCAFLTDGGFGGQSVARRQQESLAVLRALGIVEDRVHWIGSQSGFADGRLHLHLPAALEALAGLLERIGGVDALHVPAWEGGHQDHDAAHLLGLALARRAGIAGLAQFPLYTGAGLPGPWFRVLAPLVANGPVMSYQAGWAERALAVALCLKYVSQWRTWIGLLPFFALRMLTSGGFPEQGVNEARVAEPPHPGRLLYERRGFLAYSEFRASAVPFMQSVGLLPQ